jgi:hypothetical protein
MQPAARLYPPKVTIFRVSGNSFSMHPLAKNNSVDNQETIYLA